MLKPAYALIGDDAFLVQQRLQSLLKGAADLQRTDLDGERAELSEVLDELRSFAMFGGGKLVVVTSAEAFITRFRPQLEDYLAAPSSSATLILRVASLPAQQRIYKLIDKLGGIEKCEPPRDLARWIVAHARTAHKLNVAPDAARLLADLVGRDLGRLDGELAKLALQSDSGKVAVNDVAGSVAFQREQEMRDMTNELAAGRVREALRRWRHLVQLDPSAEFRAVTWLTIWLENVGKALQLKGQGVADAAIPERLRVWPMDQRPLFMKTVNALGPAGLRRALDLLAQVDLHNKSGVGEAATNVERFILSLGAR